jgi:hypothetical protein
MGFFYFNQRLNIRNFDRSTEVEKSKHSLFQNMRFFDFAQNDDLFITTQLARQQSGDSAEIISLYERDPSTTVEVTFSLRTKQLST